eukprot:CAMPEP_0175038698 /NCGR_PEP_ID=MMETSP0052_2-20121109/21_1 /TAXON_ID=51329 ORGANISM="Polytomella parva, Strain SAG 63-3" /NCGR_SAMPLE_ID=MMETSP0052_2 /ASSEMBLY_ACC=CAM_ASM_000194 /LENGTH=277 /DNA_ID=CAMNT_0016300165 /DNA_START=71 /DNA_END=904 /DNA_ORIENTATION=+
MSTHSETLDVATALADVKAKIKDSAERSGSINYKLPRLVAVSKTKPVEAIMEAYNAGQRVFGENYVQEIVEKAPKLPLDINWHFIGHMQSNKVRSVIEAVPNLSMIETIDSIKLADRINRMIGDASTSRGSSPESSPKVSPRGSTSITKEKESSLAANVKRLDVLIQINTSGETSKSGVDPGPSVLSIASHIKNNCPNLRFAGLMTIGMPDDDSDFRVLSRCRDEVAAALQLTPEESQQLELSMGMSGDYERAIACGSTNVRVGSSIFGARAYPPKS